MNFAPGKIPSGGHNPRKCIYTVNQRKTWQFIFEYNFG